MTANPVEYYLRGPQWANLRHAVYQAEENREARERRGTKKAAMMKHERKLILFPDSERALRCDA